MLGTRIGLHVIGRISQPSQLQQLFTYVECPGSRSCHLGSGLGQSLGSHNFPRSAVLEMCTRKATGKRQSSLGAQLQKLDPTLLRAVWICIVDISVELASDVARQLRTQSGDVILAHT